MLKIYTGNRLEKLLDLLDANICCSGTNPLIGSSICIQTPGMQRWIGLKLAEKTGISANLDFIFPGALMKRLAGVKAGERALWPEKQELIWSVFSKLLNLPQEPIYDQINSYLEDDEGNIKAFRLAGRIADTFDQYQIYRPEMILDWLSPSPKQTPKDDKDIWQLEMFRSLFANKRNCKTSVFHRFIKDAEKAKPENINQNSPLHIFGISVLPAFFIDMLKAASLHTDVYFYLLSPTRQYWGDSHTVRDIRRKEKRTGLTAQQMYIEEKHELLDNLGVIGRDFFDHILGSDDSFITEEYYEDISADTMLNTVQAEILDLERVDSEPAYDNSIIINSCHNPLREMETLYDQLLDIFQSGKDLQPSDVLVMTPDIEKYSPYIKAVFDNPYDDRSAIPYSIADISERQTNRPAGVFLELLSLLEGDFSLSDVFKVLSYDIVADNFDINITDLNTLSSVFENSGAFWGHDAEHLKSEGLEITDIFTWKKALRRISLGLAEGSTGCVYIDAAVKDIPFSLAEQIGGVMRFADKAAYYSKLLKTNMTISDWCALMHEIAETFLSQSYNFADDTLNLNSSIAEIAAESSEFTDPINFTPVEERLKEMLGETRGAKGFMSGRVTFCAMLPMRSIPFRIIAIAGLDENTFPRQKVSLEFDLMAKSPKPGDRNNRDSDRYLFLETLISARDKLILSYKGQSERDNSELPPSTLVTELLTHMQNRFAQKDITTRHKLHSFSRDYFKGGRLFTYSPARYAAAIALSGEKKPHSFADLPVETEELTEVTLADFENFFVSPPAYFLKKTLGINSRIYDETLPETEHMVLDGLNNYNLQEDSINRKLAGDNTDALTYQYMTAQLPPENLGIYYIEETRRTSSAMAENAFSLLGGRPEEKEIELTVDDVLIKAHIPGISGARHAYIRPAKIKPKDLIKGWIRHLLLNIESPFTTLLIGNEAHIELPPYSGNHLQELMKLFKKGCRTPLRFHISDGTEMIKRPKGISADKYNKLANDFAFQICFGGEIRPDEEITNIVLKPIIEHIQGVK